jgi:hypothetical protein
LGSSLGCTAYTCRTHTNIAFTKIDVAINIFNGPMPVDCIILSGRIKRLTLKIPRGGIHEFCIAADTDTSPFLTYKTHPVAKHVSTKLMSGSTIHPRSVNDQCEKEGYQDTRPNVMSVKITECTIPNVRRMA